MSTQAQEIKNMRLISHCDLNGFPNVGEGMAMQTRSDGRRVMWLAHESAPKDVTAVDVTDLANPRVVTQTDLPYPYLRSNSLAVIDDFMLVAYQSSRPGVPGGGMGVYDISTVLRQELERLHAERGEAVRPGQPVIYSERGGGLTANTVTVWFHILYHTLGLTSCSSHSGRRTFITQAAKKVVEAGGSLDERAHSTLEFYVTTPGKNTLARAVRLQLGTSHRTCLC